MRKKVLHILALIILAVAISATPWPPHHTPAVAVTSPPTSSVPYLISGLELLSLIDGLDVEYINPEVASLKGENPNVHVAPVDFFVRVYTYFTKSIPPDLVELSVLTQLFEGWTPVYLPNEGYKLEDQILLSTGIIDRELIARVKQEILDSGFEPDKIQPGEGYIVLLKDVIPPNYPADKIVIDRFENRIALWPTMELETELNIPAYHWRIWHKVNGKRYLIADWPVIVGKTSTRTRVAALPMDMMEHYPPWTDPETKEHVKPGPGNPLGLWKLRSTHTRRLWYYHGTNKPWLLKRPYRAFSHGCIRNDNNNIRNLGWLLLSHNAGIEERPGRVTGRTDVFPERRYRKIPLVTPVMAKNVYDTIEVERRQPPTESILAFYPNVYYIQLENEYYRPPTENHLKFELKKLGFEEKDIDADELKRTIQIMRHLRRPAFMEAAKILKSQ